ncbi:MAG: hypothetical protein ACOYNL_04270 [Rickettsiales bacterium]
MKKFLVAVAAVSALAAAPAMARSDTHISFGFYAPAAPVYYQPAPVVYYPPVHNVYYAPPQRVAYYGRPHRGHGWGNRGYATAWNDRNDWRDYDRGRGDWRR